MRFITVLLAFMEGFRKHGMVKLFLVSVSIIFVLIMALDRPDPLSFRFFFFNRFWSALIPF